MLHSCFELLGVGSRSSSSSVDLGRWRRVAAKEGIGGHNRPGCCECTGTA
jgi:hypothetical protein